MAAAGRGGRPRGASTRWIGVSCMQKFIGMLAGKIKNFLTNFLKNL
jgi:hypothetical protein